MRKRYLFFDIDGTLIAGGYYGNNYIPESTHEAIRKLKETGHFLCLATGRSEALSRSYMEECGIRNMVSDGGYGLTIDGKLLGIRPLPKDDIVALIRNVSGSKFPGPFRLIIPTPVSRPTGVSTKLPATSTRKRASSLA